MSGRGRTVVGAAVVVTAITAVSRVVGFARWFVFSAAVGNQGCTGSVYAAVNAVPNIAFEAVAGGALAGLTVPVIAGQLAEGRAEDAERTAAALLTRTVVGLAVLAAALAVLAGPVAGVLLHDLQDRGCPAVGDLGRRMLLVFAPQVVLYGVAVVLGGVLQAHRRFTWPAAAPLLSSAVVIAGYLGYAAAAGTARRDARYLPGTGPELLLTVGTTAGVAALALPLLWPARRAGLRLRPRWRFPAGTGGTLAGLAAAGVVTLAAQQLATAAVLVVAGAGGRGVLPAYQAAQALFTLPYAVLAVPLAVAGFPQLSRYRARQQVQEFADLTAWSLRAVLAVSLVGAAALAAAGPAAQVAYLGIDAVGGGALRSLDAALVVLAPGLLGWGLVAVAGRVLFAHGRGPAAAVATCAGWVAVCLASLAVLPLTGPTHRDAAMLGLAGANTLGMTLGGLLLLRAVRRSAGAAALAGVGRCLALGVPGALLGALAGRGLLAWVAPGPADAAAALGWAALAAAVAGGLCAAALTPVLPWTRLPELLRSRIRGAPGA